MLENKATREEKMQIWRNVIELRRAYRDSDAELCLKALLAANGDLNKAVPLLGNKEFRFQAEYSTSLSDDFKECLNPYVRGYLYKEEDDRNITKAASMRNRNTSSRRAHRHLAESLLSRYVLLTPRGCLLGAYCLLPRITWYMIHTSIVSSVCHFSVLCAPHGVRLPAIYLQSICMLYALCPVHTAQKLCCSLCCVLALCTASSIGELKIENDQCFFVLLWNTIYDIQQLRRTTTHRLGTCCDASILFETLCESQDEKINRSPLLHIWRLYSVNKWRMSNY